MDIDIAEQNGMLEYDDSNLILKMLDDDCLFHILSYLNLQELIRVEEVCERFEAVAQQVYKTYTTLDFSDHLLRNKFAMQKQIPIAEATAIASRVGPSIHTLTAKASTFRMNDHQIPNFVGMYFKKLRNVNFHWFKIMDDESLAKMATAFTGVTVVKLDGCDATDKILQGLFKVDQLEVLELPNNPEINGTFFVQLRNIRDINLECCHNVDPQLFRQFCEEHPNLRSLNVRNCSWIDRICLQHIAALSNLETLGISANYRIISMNDYLILADLPKLKHLQIDCGKNSEWNMDELLLKVSIHNQLESLVLMDKEITADTEKSLRYLTNIKELDLSSSSKCTDITLESLSCENTLQRLEIQWAPVTPKGLEMLIKRCPHLRVLNVVKCPNINGDFVPQILEHLKERPHMLEMLANDHPRTFPRKKFEKIYTGRNSSKLKVKFQSYIKFLNLN